MIKWYHTLTFIGVMLLFGAVAAVVGRSYSATQERTVTYDYLSDAIKGVADVQQNITWIDPIAPLTRDVLASDQRAVGKAMTQAWQAIAISQSSGQGEFLSDYFSGAALIRTKIAAAEANQTAGMVILEQQATPLFFHKDGSLMQLELKAKVVRYFLGPKTPGNTDAPQTAARPVIRQSHDTFLVTLLNETVGWRVVSMELRQSTPIKARAVQGPKLQRLAGINYYPALSPWTLFWQGYDAATTKRDFALIKSLNANAVRIFLHRDDFVNLETRARAVASLQNLISVAADNGLYLVATLFDLKQDFSPSTWADDMIYLDIVLPELSAAQNIAFIDVKNQADLDDAVYSSGLVDVWVEMVVTKLRSADPSLLVSVGWSDGIHVARLQDILDVLSYTDYAKADSTGDRIATGLASGKPVVLSEIGVSSWTAGLGFPSSDAFQAEDLALRLAQSNSAAGIFIWTLYDFPKTDPKAVGNSPWAKRIQSKYGLFTDKAVPKPAAAIVRDYFKAYLQGN